MSPKSNDTIRVLFVEDAFDQALLVKTFLSPDDGYDVTHVQDGDLAVQLIQDQEWDLIITDLNLPGTDGFEVIRAGRAKSADVPIMATTGYTGAEYEEEALRAGGNKVLLKPLERDDFLATIQTLLTGGQPEAPPAILAVGGLAGDVEMGCGGALMQAVAEGFTVFVVPLARDELDTKDAALAATKKACALMGFKLVVDKPALDDTRRRMAVIEKAVHDLNPTRLYIPTMDDDHPARMEAFRVGQSAAGPVATVLGYQTGTTGLDFRPTHFVDVAEQMAVKTDALELFSAAKSGRLDLTPDMAKAYARYWGRMKQYTEVEAFEVIKGKV